MKEQESRRQNVGAAKFRSSSIRDLALFGWLVGAFLVLLAVAFSPGSSNSGNFNNGGRYSPSTNTWTTTSITNAPETRHLHTAVWTGTQTIVWGGANGSGTIVNTADK